MHRELEEQRGLAGLDIKEAMYEASIFPYSRIMVSNGIASRTDKAKGSTVIERV